MSAVVDLHDLGPYGRQLLVADLVGKAGRGGHGRQLLRSLSDGPDLLRVKVQLLLRKQNEQKNRGGGAGRGDGAGGRRGRGSVGTRHARSPNAVEGETRGV